MTRRQNGLAEMEKRLDKDLNSLNKNIQADLETSSNEMERMRRLTSSVSSLIAGLSFLFAGLVLWTGRRVIISPMQVLTRQVRQVAQGDFSPVQPLKRQDEIGELSQAIALMTDWLRDSYELMEQRVVERTQEVERRRAELQISAQVARDIASARNLEALLNLAVNLIRDRFDFYHAGIFLNDDRGEYAVLRAATGEAGRELLARQHRLRIGSSLLTERSNEGIAVGLVGHAAQTGDPQVALDVGQDAIHFRNPLLPNTRSEAAIPLKTGGQIIGVLDIQSIQANAFDAETLQMFQVMADQLATAIQNARLLEEVQQNLNELRTAYGQVDRQAWERFTRAAPLLGYQYDGNTLLPLTQREPAPEPAEGEAYSVSLRVRGTEIGALQVWGRSGGLNEAETRMVSNLSGRLSQILESARLYEEVQARAAREQMINRLTADLARSLDTEGVLRTAAFQLGNLPSVIEATVSLNANPREAHPTPPTASPEQPEADGGNEIGGGNGHRP